MEEVKEVIKGLNEEVQTLKSKLHIYEEQQGNMMQDMKVQVAVEVKNVMEHMQEVYRQSHVAVTDLHHRLTVMEGRVKEVEDARKTHEATKKGLIPPKNILPDKLAKTEEWKGWKSDVEDYCEENFPGMKEMLEKVKKSETEVNELWFGPHDDQWWARSEMLWRFLKRYTKLHIDAKKVVVGTRDDNGWEAWRKLGIQFEPNLATREAMLMAQFTGMVNKRAKNTTETKTLMLELEERAKRVEDITEEPIDDKHAMSVIVGILDTETLKHTAQYQGAKKDIEVLKTKVMDFVNMMAGTTGKSDPMDLNRFQTHEEGEEEEEWGEEEEHNHGGLNAMGEVCYECGLPGHYARECPWKGKGKGGKGYGKAGKGGGGGGGKNNKGSWKGYGKGGKQQEGKGKGKPKGSKDGKGQGKSWNWNQAPMYGTCFGCGGPHFQRDCPNKGANSLWTWMEGEDNAKIKSLSSVKEVNMESRRRWTTTTRMTPIQEEDQTEDTPSLCDSVDSEEEAEEKEKKEEEEDDDDDDADDPKSHDGQWAEFIGKKKKEMEEQRKEEQKEEEHEEQWTEFMSKKKRKAIKRTELRQKTMKEKRDKRKWKPFPDDHKKEDSINSLKTVLPQGVNMVGPTDGEEEQWEELEMAVDSAATETVMNEEMLTGIETTEG